MNITIEHISKGIIHWAEVDLISKGSLIQQGITTFIVLQTKPRIMNMLSSLVLLSDNGVFDIDELSTNLHKGLEKMGGVYSIPLINYQFDVDDLDNIIEYIRKQV